MSTRKRWLTVGEVAAELRISPWKVRQLIAAEQLPAVRLGPRLLRVPREALEQWLRAGIESLTKEAAELTARRELGNTMS